MQEDSSLFKYQLAVAAILKNEAPYVKEWLDYHLLAGVDHFYLYDNESEDNLKEILQPYIDKGLVDYKFYPGKCAQMAAYNETVQRYKFECRYIAFIDLDEFILPRANNIKGVLNEVMAKDLNAAGLVINWHNFGTSNQEKADLSKGVLERFLNRASDDFEVNTHVKTIANPRCIDLIVNPHFAIYFSGKYAVNENGAVVAGYSNQPCTADKIIINHYSTKSKEETIKKINRGMADHLTNTYDLEWLKKHDRNDIYDDRILSYREARRSVETEIESQEQIAQRLFTALRKNLMPALNNAPVEFYQNQVCRFLTCWSVSQTLRQETSLSEQESNLFEGLALDCINESLMSTKLLNLWQVQLLIDELPEILLRPYPAAAKLKILLKQIIPYLMEMMRQRNNWRIYKNLKYVIRFIK